jgi:hypothetical protein
MDFSRAHADWGLETPFFSKASYFSDLVRFSKPTICGDRSTRHKNGSNPCRTGDYIQFQFAVSTFESSRSSQAFHAFGQVAYLVEKAAIGGLWCP